MPMCVVGEGWAAGGFEILSLGSPSAQHLGAKRIQPLKGPAMSVLHPTSALIAL